MSPRTRRAQRETDLANASEKRAKMYAQMTNLSHRLLDDCQARAEHGTYTFEMMSNAQETIEMCITALRDAAEADPDTVKTEEYKNAEYFLHLDRSVIDQTWVDNNEAADEALRTVQTGYLDTLDDWEGDEVVLDRDDFVARLQATAARLKDGPAWASLSAGDKLLKDALMRSVHAKVQAEGHLTSAAGTNGATESQSNTPTATAIPSLSPASAAQDARPLEKMEADLRRTLNQWRSDLQDAQAQN